jgi:hypothetical protein
VDGHFVNASGQTPAGDEEVSELLQRILMWAEIVLERCVELIRLKRLILVVIANNGLEKVRSQMRSYQHSKLLWVYGMSSKNCL